MKVHNLNCDGAECQEFNGEVRKYPLGGGANMILCRACFAYENRYRNERRGEPGQQDNWPRQEWRTAEVYGEQSHDDET